MNESQENEFEISSIDPNSWQNIPKPLTKAIDILIKTCVKQNFQIKTLRKDLKTLNSSHKSQSFLYETFQRSSDTKFQTLTNSTNENFNKFRKEIEESLQIFYKDYNESKQTLHNLQRCQIDDVLSLKNLIESNKESLKSEILSKHIKPEIEKLKSEMNDQNKSLIAMDKHLNFSIFQSEKSSDELKFKLENQKIEIFNLKNSLASISSQFEKIVQLKTEDLQSIIKVYETRIEDSYSAFNHYKENFFSELFQKEEKLKSFFDEKIKYIDNETLELKRTSENLWKSNLELTEQCRKLKEGFEFETERIRIQSEKYILDCYAKAKEKLTHCYREDVKILKQKLEWLPQDLENIQDLAPLEARLYTLESRLKREETNRMVQNMELLKEIEDKIASFGSLNRSITPTNASDTRMSKNRFPLNGLKTLGRIREKTPELTHKSLNYSILKFPNY